MPISSIDGCDESHWQAVRSIVEEALDGTELDVELVSDADDVGVIQKRIIQNIYDNDIVVCDVSCKNPNVMFELGMRLAFDRPAVIIKDDATTYSFDTAPVEHLPYPRGLNYHKIQEFKSTLKGKVVATLKASERPDYTTFLKHFGKFVVATLEEQEVGKDDYVLQSLGEIKRDLSKLRARPSRTYEAFHEASLEASTESDLRALAMGFLLRKISAGELGASDLVDENGDVYPEVFSDFLHSDLVARNGWRPAEIHLRARSAFNSAVRTFGGAGGSIGS